jgi:hypothetical protein
MKIYCVCIPLLSTTALQNIFHSNQHTHNYLSESNAQDVFEICRTCDVFNIAEKHKSQLQCIKSDTLYTDIKWDSRQVIQEGYKTISCWLTHTAKESIQRHYDQQCWHIRNHQQHSSITNLLYSRSLIFIQMTRPQILTQRSEMLPAQFISIQTYLSCCFPNQLLTHFFQL